MNQIDKKTPSRVGAGDKWLLPPRREAAGPAAMLPGGQLWATEIQASDGTELGMVGHAATV